MRPTGVPPVADVRGTGILPVRPTGVAPVPKRSVHNQESRGRLMTGPSGSVYPFDVWSKDDGKESIDGSGEEGYNAGLMTILNLARPSGSPF